MAFRLRVDGGPTLQMLGWSAVCDCGISCSYSLAFFMYHCDFPGVPCVVLLPPPLWIRGYAVIQGVSIPGSDSDEGSDEFTHRLSDDYTHIQHFNHQFINSLSLSLSHKCCFLKWVTKAEIFDRFTLWIYYNVSTLWGIETHKRVLCK